MLGTNISACGGEEFNYDYFAQCLTEKGVSMYGVEDCPACEMQKDLFGDSFKYIDYIDCYKEIEVCIEAQVPAYPAWKAASEKKGYVGVMSLDLLSKIYGCELTNPETETAESDEVSDSE